MSTALTDLALWEKKYTETVRPRLYPEPRKFLLDFELVRLFRRHLKNSSAGRALEFGCGASVWLGYFRREFGYEVWGIDYSPAGIRACREVLARLGCEATLLCQDISLFPQELVGSFDLVFSLGLLEHFENQAEILRIFASAARPGGKLITWVPNFSGYILRLSNRVNPDRAKIYHKISLEELVRLHEACHLEIVEATYVQPLDFSLFYLGRLSGFFRRSVAATFNLTALPVILVYERLGLKRRPESLSAGVAVVALKRRRE